MASEKSEVRSRSRCWNDPAPQTAIAPHHPRRTGQATVQGHANAQGQPLSDRWVQNLLIFRDQLRLPAQSGSNHQGNRRRPWHLHQPAMGTCEPMPRTHEGKPRANATLICKSRTSNVAKIVACPESAVHGSVCIALFSHRAHAHQ